MNFSTVWPLFPHSGTTGTPTAMSGFRNILNIPEHCTGIAGTSTKLTETEQKNGKNN
jgi:hypothetical protein